MTLSMNWIEKLAKEIQDSSPESFPVSLGIQRMPNGYELMWSSITEYFYWLRWDGIESNINCNKWAVYKSAKADSVKFRLGTW